MDQMTEERAMKDIDTYTALIASEKKRMDECVEQIADYAEKLRRAASYLSN